MDTEQLCWGFTFIVVLVAVTEALCVNLSMSQLILR